MKKVKVGVIGCGNISRIYMQNLQKFEITELVACADIDIARAEQRAEEFGIPKSCTPEQLLADPEIEIVVNLTVPAAHAEVSMMALQAGKHVYVEKPLAATVEEGERVLKLARERGLMVGGAPETFLGGGIQTCRKLIDAGWIGTPVAATAFMMASGHEHWHPQPDFFYEPGGGPMLDMGPYYITALIHLLGPIRRVSGSARITFPERTATSKGNEGRKIKVHIPTHVSGTIDFANGAIGQITTSFDIAAGTQLPHIEIYGSEGTLRVPDPNTFGGPVLLRTKQTPEWKEVPLTHGFTSNNRGIGVMDMAYALQEGRPHRASGELAYHCLEVMHAFMRSSETNEHVMISSTCERPEPMPVTLLDDRLSN